jgi:hypothetical protein
MEGERSSIIDIMGNTSEAPLPEASTTSSSSDASSRGAASDVAKAEAEDTVDPHELAQSYDIRASSVTIGRIRQLESLRYFAERFRARVGGRDCPEAKRRLGRCL